MNFDRTLVFTALLEEQSFRDLPMDEASHEVTEVLAQAQIHPDERLDVLARNYWRAREADRQDAPCQRGTDGCSVDHAGRSTKCETW